MVQVESASLLYQTYQGDFCASFLSALSETKDEILCTNVASLDTFIFSGQCSYPCLVELQTCLMLCADHGPCVSGAHSTIVTTLAGKDLVSCLVSGK